MALTHSTPISPAASAPPIRLIVLIAALLASPARPQVADNLPPTVDLGPDRLVVPPDHDIELPAIGADLDGQVIAFVWRQIDGPHVDLQQSQTSVALVSGLTSFESHVFECLVMDDGGAIGSDKVTVEVVDCSAAGGVVAGSPTAHQPVRVDFQGPPSSELASPNPFLDVRLDVAFTHADSGMSFTVPGYFAADGAAAETGSSSGSVWRAHLLPHRPGTWVYEPSFRTGPDVAVSDDPLAGAPLAFDGATGCFEVLPPDPAAQGFHATGRLLWTGEHVLRHAVSGAPFLKGGANSPENLLAFADFDGTTPSHDYLPHLADWQAGDPTWDGGRGQALIGALNYLAGAGMNAVYFLTNTAGGDGDDVWPWTSSSERLRYDCSKLDQWEIVFGHMDRLGLAPHVVTQEQENDNGAFGLDGGALGTERKLYYRELVARFGHHPGVIWNLGEENTNTPAQRIEFYDHLRALDAYDHPIVVHSYPGQQAAVYGPLLDDGRLEGPSLQSGQPAGVHAQTLLWRAESAAHGRPWVVFSDEIGPSTDGVVPDAVDFWHDVPRKQVLWGNLMAGGAGVEWYFGYAHPHSDLTCEDWRSRDQMWRLTRHALDFFRAHVDVAAAVPADELVDAPGASCLAVADHRYVVYLPQGGTTRLRLDQALLTYDVRWFDPRHGGPLQVGSVTSVQGPAWASLGDPPSAPDDDWAILLTQVEWTGLSGVVGDTPD